MNEVTKIFSKQKNISKTLFGDNIYKDYLFFVHYHQNMALKTELKKLLSTEANKMRNNSKELVIGMNIKRNENIIEEIVKERQLQQQQPEEEEDDHQENRNGKQSRSDVSAQIRNVNVRNHRQRYVSNANGKRDYIVDELLDTFEN